MEFDVSNLYTRENADELSNEHGAIVCVAYSMPELKELVENYEPLERSIKRFSI